jgi:hypothetical protein
MGDTRISIVVALATVLGNGSGWQSLANIDPGVPWRAELSSAAAGADQVEVWVSSDNTGPVNYVGKTPPGGVLLVTLEGVPGGTAATIAPSQQGPALYANFVRKAGATALNALVTGGLAVSGAGPAPGTYWAVGGNAAGPITGGTLDGSAVTVGGLSAASPTTIAAGAGAGITIQAPTGQAVGINVGGTPATTNVGTGAAAQTVNVGSVTTTSATAIRSGSGGIGIGQLTPGGSQTAIDTQAAAAILIGQAVANAVTIGGTGSAVATATVQAKAAGTVNINNGAVAATTNVGTGPAAQTVNVGSLTTTSQTTIDSGSGGTSIASEGVVSVTGTSIGIDASGAVNVGAASATSVTIGNTTTGALVRVNVGPGGFGVNVNPDASALADFNGSTTRGVKFPNLTTVQKNAIAAPGAGLVVFDTTLAKLCVYSGAAWQTITSV